MMSRINLLPWRDKAKKTRNIRFYLWAGLSALVGLLCSFLAHLYLTYRMDVENNNIQYLQKEQHAIIDKVKEIQGLQQSKKELLSRMKIIQTLENDRILVAKLLDALPRIMPNNIYLKTLTRKEKKVVIEGNARTNAAISTLLKNMESSQWGQLFNDPKLTEIKVNKDDGSQNFQLEFNLGT